MLPLDYTFILQVSEVKLALPQLNLRRRLLSKFTFKQSDALYGISDNQKLTISNLIPERMADFVAYFDKISVGIECKGEDFNNSVTLYCASLLDLIIVSERLHSLTYSDPTFRSFGINSKIYL